jgi:hypothetical protein
MGATLSEVDALQSPQFVPEVILPTQGEYPLMVQSHRRGFCLFAAVIRMAIADGLGVQRRRARAQHTIDVRRTDARAWVQAPWNRHEPSLGSFAFYCAWLGVDIAQAQAAIVARWERAARPRRRRLHTAGSRVRPTPPAPRR